MRKFSLIFALTALLSANPALAEDVAPEAPAAGEVLPGDLAAPSIETAKVTADGAIKNIEEKTRLEEEALTKIHDGEHPEHKWGHFKNRRGALCRGHNRDRGAKNPTDTSAVPADDSGNSMDPQSAGIEEAIPDPEPDLNLINQGVEAGRKSQIADYQA